MKTNTLTLVGLPCDQIGTLVILGSYENKVTFLATDLLIIGDIKEQIDLAFGGDCIVTLPSSSNKSKRTVIFQYCLVGPLRDPKGLLKAVRAKLHVAIKKAFNAYAR